MELNELKQKIDNFFNSLSEEEKVKLKEKYFFHEYDTHEGWVSIEESLPEWRASDLFEGGTEYKVLFEDGSEDYSRVSDPNIWYYWAKEAGVTHWCSEK